jgi:hypothetical protein
MKVWLAFDATDINCENKLQIEDLKYLIYTLEGIIPTEDRLYYEMKELDKDKSGFVTREEWLHYLCVN